MYLQKFFHSHTGKIMLSIILGIGIASLFKKVCKEKNCIIFKAPEINETDIYKFNDKCYKYKSLPSKCNSNKKTINYA